MRYASLALAGAAALDLRQAPVGNRRRGLAWRDALEDAADGRCPGAVEARRGGDGTGPSMAEAPVRVASLLLAGAAALDLPQAPGGNRRRGLAKRDALEDAADGRCPGAKHGAVVMELGWAGLRW